MENPTYNREKEREYKHLADAVYRHVSEAIKIGSAITLASIISSIELGSLISIRRTFSKDSMLKAYLLFKLKHIKSYEALSNYLRNRPEEAIALGFDKSDDGKVRVPTHQNMSHFVGSLSDDDIALLDASEKKILATAEKFDVELDIEKKPLHSKNESPKTIYNHRIEKTKEMVNFIKKKLQKKSGFDPRYNAVFKGSELIDEIIWLGFERNFAESGCRILSDITGKRMPNADTLLYHLKKIGIEKMKLLFNQLIDQTFRNARQRGIITDRPVDVAIDVTPAYRFYGKMNTEGAAGYKPERGTSFAYQFISIDIVEHNQRLTLMALPVFHRGDQNKQVEQLLTYAKERMKINRVLLDRGFFDSECINMMNRLGLRYIMPAKMNSIDVRKISRLSAPRIVPNCAMKSCRFNLVVAEIKGEKRYFATNIPTRSDDLIFAFRIADMYRRRWQIETGYRTKKYSFLPKTTSRNYAVRYFYFMMSVILYNYWVIADISILLYLGLNTRKTQITAKTFAIRLIGIERRPGG